MPILPADLYDHYLIDPEMSPCRTSTRILHAVSAVQLFIQRCTVNLEPDVSPSVIAQDRLPWMSQYRVWQANREVFLFPENWIEPELRDDKSEVFQDLEGQLLQDELDSARATDILKDYLKGLEDISNLVIVGLYVERAADALGNAETRVHMVGRTSNHPAHFYYRRWVVSTLRNSWDPWERIALEGVKSDHILPFVMRGDVYIAWPEIIQIAADRGTDSKDPGPSWRIHIAWIRRTNGGWGDRLLSADTLEHPWVYGKDENQTFTFRVRNEQSGRVSIDCYGAQRDNSDGLLYQEPFTGDGAGYRTYVPFPETNPWINVQISGVVYASYSGGTVWHALKGAQVSVATSFQGSAQDRNQASHDLQSDIHNSIYTNTDQASTVTGDDGVFVLSLSLFAQLITNDLLRHSTGYYEDSVLQASPTFDVSVSYPGASPQTKSFPYADPNSNDTKQYWSAESFQQSFIIALGGSPPTGDPNRPVAMGPISTFRLFAADDASFEGLITPFPALPSGVLSYGSGFQFTNANQNDSLAFDGTDTSNAPTVWNGVALTYTLLRNAPFQPDITPGADPAAVTPAAVCVYRDNQDSYLIRIENSLTDPPDAVNEFQILLDGHPRISDLRQAAVLGPASVFDLGQQSWSGAPPNAVSRTFDNHTASSLFDLNTSLTLPAMYFEPDQAQSPYAKYNTELFFQVPFLIATFLSRNQRFADAQTWLQYVFNPTSSDASPVPERYWRYLPFRNHSQTTAIDELMKLLAHASVPATNADKRDITTQIEIWLQNPFAPHAIARVRPRAYEFSVVFKYLDNLIAWGDSLFRQYSTESINLATQVYLLAVKLLGPRPQSIPRAQEPAPLTYRDVNNQWDAFSNAWVEIESNLNLHPMLPPVSRVPFHQQGVGPGIDLSHLSNIGTLYFCIPGNDRILAYWDSLDQRLFNIRHCRNIDGVEQLVPLFQPPIDPALLVQAVAEGVDISSIIADIAAPTPLYRFNTVVQKAVELCNELKSLGGALLTALEKKDAEDLALLRSGQELDMLRLVQAMKESQVAEARANIDTLNQSEQVATTRFVQYQRLLGKNGAQVPDDEGADVEQSSAVRVAGGDATGEFGGLGLTKPEYDQIGYSEDALRFGTVAGIHSIVSGILYAIPGTQAGTPFLSEQFGGLNLGSVVSAAGSFWSVLERNATHQSSRSASIGQYQRRQDDWVFQSRMALRDIQQIRKQVIAARIRLDISQKDLENHKQQIRNAEDSDRFMREKYTNRDLYQWETQQISAVYFRAYQLAYDVAKRAERCFRFELGVSDSSFINFGYWDSLKKGLTTGERLALDLKRMEAAYLERNQREYEITKHVSLMQLDPEALVALRQLGGCEFTIPEVLYDLDFPGHYFRRLKSVGMSVPCVVGPLAGVPATLKLVKSSIRTESTVESGYPQGVDDPRFLDILTGMQTVALSSGQNDTGLFENNLRDERFLPFEGMGAISTWRIEMPADFRPFDYDSIADVILHIRYTARDGGDDLKSGAIGNLKAGLNNVVRMSQAQGLTRMFSVKSDFSSEWYRPTNPANPAADASAGLTLTRNRFPYLFSNNQIKLTITGVDLYAVPDPSVEDPTFPDFLDVSTPVDPAPLEWPDSTTIGPLQGKSASTSVPVTSQEATAKWTVSVPVADVARLRDETKDLLFVCRYKVG